MTQTESIPTRGAHPKKTPLIIEYHFRHGPICDARTLTTKFPCLFLTLYVVLAPECLPAHLCNRQRDAGVHSEADGFVRNATLCTDLSHKLK